MSALKEKIEVLNLNHMVNVVIVISLCTIKVRLCIIVWQAAKRTNFSLSFLSHPDGIETSECELPSTQCATAVLWGAPLQVRTCLHQINTRPVQISL